MIPGLSSRFVPTVSAAAVEAGVLDSVGHYQTTRVSTLTKAWTLPADTDCLVLIIATGDNSALEDESSATWNGVAFTNIANAEANVATGKIRIKYLLNPDVGAHDCVVNFADAYDAAIIGLIALRGIASSGTVNTAATNVDNDDVKDISTVTTSRSLRVYGRFESDDVTFANGGTTLLSVTGQIGALTQAAFTMAYYLEAAASTYNFTSDCSGATGSSAGVASLAAFKLA